MLFWAMLESDSPGLLSDLGKCYAGAQKNCPSHLMGGRSDSKIQLESLQPEVETESPCADVGCAPNNWNNWKVLDYSYIKNVDRKSTR